MCRATAKVAGIQEETADAFHGALADSDIDKWTVSLNPLIMNDAILRHPTLTQIPGEFPIGFLA